MEKEVRIGVRITEKLRDEFMDICNENSYNASALIRRWIEEFIKKNKKNKKA